MTWDKSFSCAVLFHRAAHCRVAAAVWPGKLSQMIVIYFLGIFSTDRGDSLQATVHWGDLPESLRRYYLFPEEYRAAGWMPSPPFWQTILTAILSFALIDQLIQPHSFISERSHHIPIKSAHPDQMLHRLALLVGPIYGQYTNYLVPVKVVECQAPPSSVPRRTVWSQDVRSPHTSKTSPECSPSVTSPRLRIIPH